MKHLILILALCICLAACKKTTTSANTNAHISPPSTTSTLIITVNSATITAGQSVILTASGATSYTWMPSGATTNTINVAPNSTTSYTVTGTQGGNSGTAISVVTVVTSTITSKDSVWFNLNFIYPGPVKVISFDSAFAKNFMFAYDTNTVRLYLNGQKINASSYNYYVLYHIGNSNGWLQSAQNYPTNTSSTLKTPILMNKNDSLTLEVDSAYCFFSSNTTFNFVDLLIDKNGHVPYNNTQVTTTEYTCTYNTELMSATANGTNLRWVGLAPMNGANAQQQWYIGGKYKCTWVNH